MSSKLVTWVDDDVEFFGQTVPLRLKLPTFSGAESLVKRVEAIQTARDPGLIYEPENRAWVADVFGRQVKPRGPLDVDGVTVDSGPGLLEVASTGLVFRILGRLVVLAYLADHEGKASASPSTPSAEGERGSDGNSSPAPSTEGEAGPTP